MTFRLVCQDHDSGCFVACVAMLLNTTYRRALRKIHPGINVGSWTYVFHNVSLPPQESITRLIKLGVKLKPARAKKISSLRHDALILIRWALEPNRMHAVVYDHAKKRILDPSGRIYDLSKWKDWKIAWVEKQLYAVYYIKN